MTKHIIALSGGKDSTALSLRLKEAEPRKYLYVCTPTGDELPIMNSHWEKLESILNQEIIRITPGYDLKECCIKHKALPSWRMRFCTRDLKILPFQRWITEQAQSSQVIVYVGLRADEEGREGGVYSDCSVRFPFREWGWDLEKVQGYLEEKRVTIPRRTDCARCFFQRLPEWWELWKVHPDIYRDAEEQEKAFGHTFRSPSRDTWPASLEGLRKRFEAGAIPRGTKSLTDFSANKCRVCSL